MPVCVPLSELKDTAAFSRKVAALDEPVIVTKNGYENMIVMSPDTFSKYRLESPEEQLERLIAEAEVGIRMGRTSNARTDLLEIRSQYGL